MNDQFDLGAALHEIESPPEPTRRWFPPVSFPWHILPGDMAESIRQYGRAYASSAEPVALFMLAHIAASVGRSIDISPKPGWREPLILWVLEIAESGTGKTSKMYDLAGPIYDLQKDEHVREDTEKADYLKLSPKEKKSEPLPQKARAYWTDSFTTEGLGYDLKDHPTGGMVIQMAEASAIVNGMNEYKAKGTDREAILKLHDGKAARTCRANGSRYIEPGRVSIIGGIQPAIMSAVFQRDEGILLSDGCLFRFLFINTATEFHPLSRESWAAEYREKWESALNRALSFGSANAESPRVLCLSENAWEVYQRWNNQQREASMRMPGLLRGFIPKACGYVLRLAGCLHLLDCFYQGRDPGSIIDHQRIESAIELTEYLLSQAETTIQTLNTGEPAGKVDTLEDEIQSAILSLESEISGGMLPVSRITDYINADKIEGFLVSPERIGRTLRSMGLSGIQSGGKRIVKIDPDFLKRLKNPVQPVQPVQALDSQGFAGLSVENETGTTGTEKPESVPVVPVGNGTGTTTNPHGCKADTSCTGCTSISTGLDENGRGFI